MPSTTKHKFYANFEATLRPGDLVTFSGTSFLWDTMDQQARMESLSSRESFEDTDGLLDAIPDNQFVQHHPAHVAVVLPQHLLCEFRGLDPNETYVLESIFAGTKEDGVCDAQTGQWHNGLQIRNLRDVAKCNKDVTAWHLRTPLFHHTVRDERELSNDELQEYLGTLEALRHPLQEFWHTCRGDSSIGFWGYNLGFCNFSACMSSEEMLSVDMATRFYQAYGLISESVDPGAITVTELIEGGSYRLMEPIFEPASDSIESFYCGRLGRV
uniref:Uncharacterized protein n=1 Tax=Phaeomonas parva TaxID=124430 RepID=A0A7S1UML2_9STRA|mmetsp:Transcript_9337/g.27421  ORF Transcript_9337/g.27421 Transcript_9337/m.27421 type:complete len:270 (+) Transcript_9337:221-1030(+)